jgi:signal transduction histidine kinase
MSVHGTPRRCPPAIEEHLVRIGREALYNAVRHAQATTVRLQLDYQHDRVILRVTDDGQGYASQRDEAPPGHHGLVIMRERAAQAGGRLVVDTGPGRGTRIEAVIPTKYGEPLDADAVHGLMAAAADGQDRRAV